MRNDGYNGATNVNAATTTTAAAAAAAATTVAAACHRAQHPLTILQLTPVAAAADANCSPHNHKGTITAIASSSLCSNERCNGGYCAAAAQHDTAVDVDNEKSEGLKGRGGEGQWDETVGRGRGGEGGGFCLPYEDQGGGAAVVGEARDSDDASGRAFGDAALADGDGDDEVGGLGYR